METVIQKIYNRHDEWVFIVINYGCNRDTAEDIVQEMYLRVITYIQKTGNDITYEDDINIYFIAKTLKSIFIDTVRKEQRKPTSDYDSESYRISTNETPLFEKKYERVQELLKEMYWFDKKVYEIIEGGTKVSTLSEKTTIPYYTIYNTYKKVVEYLKDNI